MKSPITGKEILLKQESRSLDFRKESFTVSYHYLLCQESGEQFTTTDIDDLNMIQLYNQYREKHNLPFPDEIKEIREQYGLSAKKMSEVLGFGVNSYRNYENGEVPSLANSRLIQLASDPAKFKDLVALSDNIDDQYKKKLLIKIESLIEEQKENLFSFKFQDYLLGDHVSNHQTGYRRPNLAKLTEMVVFFSEKLNPWKTVLNKLLFYADFQMFKKTGHSISGVRYRAINLGPVPNNFNSIFEYMANKNDIDISIKSFPNEGEGERFQPGANRKFKGDVFDEIELEILEKVAINFQRFNTKEMIAYSHKEEAWIANEKNKSIISYRDYGFLLNEF